MSPCVNKQEVLFCLFFGNIFFFLNSPRSHNTHTIRKNPFSQLVPSSRNYLFCHFSWQGVMWNNVCQTITVVVFFFFTHTYRDIHAKCIPSFLLDQTYTCVWQWLEKENRQNGSSKPTLRWFSNFMSQVCVCVCKHPCIRACGCVRLLLAHLMAVASKQCWVLGNL